MTTDRDFDGIAKAWLADGPVELSDRVLVAVVDDVHQTRQRHARRLPWRFPTMSFSGRASALLLIGVLAAAAGLAILGGVGGKSPLSPTPAPSASVAAIIPRGSQGAAPSSPAHFTTPELSTTFISASSGISVGFPTGWTVKRATGSWRTGEILTWGDPGLDTISTADVRLNVASQRLATGQTPTDWIQADCALDTPATECAALPGGWEQVTIDGVAGYRNANGELAPADGIVPGGVIFAALVVRSGYAYQFVMDGHLDRAMFDAFLATVKLPVIPALDKTYTSTMAGYSIDYPADWTVTPAGKPWTGGYVTMSYSDRIGRLSAIAAAATTNSLSIYGTSMRLPVGTSFDTWFAGYDADRTKTNCGAPSRNVDITVDGVLGHLDAHCPDSYLEAVVPKDGRVYVFTAFWPFDRQLFESFVDTVRLTPGTATP